MRLIMGKKPPPKCNASSNASGPLALMDRRLWYSVKGRWEEFEEHSECYESQPIPFDVPIPASVPTTIPSTHDINVTQGTTVVTTGAEYLVTSPALANEPYLTPATMTMVPSTQGNVMATTIDSHFAAPTNTRAAAEPRNTNTNHLAHGSDHWPNRSPTGPFPMGRVVPVPTGRVVPVPTGRVVPMRNMSYQPAAMGALPQRPDPHFSGTPALRNDTLARETPPATGQAGKTGWLSMDTFRRVLEKVVPPSNSSSLRLPPGLINSGQNLCFINSILISLSKLPSFADDIIASRSTTTGTQLVKHLADLFEGLNQFNQGRALSTNAFRQVASARNPSLIVAPHSTTTQTQQDAAEFLMWLLSELRLCLNADGSANVLTTQTGNMQPNGSATPNQNPNLRQFANASRDQLKSKFGNPNPAELAAVRNQVIGQIEKADGRNGATYMGPMTALCEVDQLIYAEKNNSLVDDLFNGQMIDVRLCDACNGVAATTQFFDIFIVPIAPQIGYSGLVKLEDCFKLVVEVEQLTGSNGLNCDRCNRTRLLATSVVGRSRSDGNVAAAALSSPPPSLRTLAMSPIAAGTPDRTPITSDFATDNRTSTPIPGAPRPPTSVYVTNCRRRSLVSYAPPCLVVQLMRFVGRDDGNVQKLKTPVSIPMSKIALTTLLLENQLQSNQREVFYELFAVCLHVGADCIANGHYMAYALCEDGAWYRFDDSLVTEVDMQYEITTRLVRENAYLLFYKLVL